MNKNLLPKIIQAGLITGTLDITAAYVYVFIKSGQSRLFGIFKFIASGIAGKDASAGGSGMIVAGLLLHYAIAFLFTIFFFWIFPKIPALSRNRIVTGIVYGLFVWGVMNLIVVPLSRVPYRPFNTIGALINMGILMVCIGLPLSFIASAFYRKEAIKQKRIY
jgi:hypothetical protein